LESWSSGEARANPALQSPAALLNPRTGSPAGVEP